jgi:uncharacterized delta-60 repeat protein
LLRKTTLSLLLLSFIVAAPPGPGDLDPAYGTDGKVKTAFSGGVDLGGAALQPDGKIVVAGVAGNTEPYVVVRYTSDGSPDPAFGPSGNGKQPAPFIVAPRAVAVQPDGKILVGGVGQGNLPFSFALFRLNNDGSTDMTFGTGGLVIINFPSESSVYDVTVLPDGKILACGEVFLDNSFLLVRLNTNGTPDNTFGNGGTVRPKMGPTNTAIGAARAIAIQPDQKIVAVGVAEESWAIARFHPTGELDEDFSGDGKILFNFGVATEEASDVVLQPDGKIVVSGWRSGATGGQNSVVARLNSDGSPDVTFGSGANGIVQPVQGDTRATSVVLETSGKILITGDIFQPSLIDVIVVRLNTDGSNDAAFATGGIARTDFGGDDRATELLLQLDGKVVAAGQSVSGGSGAFVLARYLTTAADEPVLQTEAGTNHAIALDSVTFKRDPFSVANDFVLNPDHRTRVILFAANMTLSNGEDASAVTAQAEDSGGVHNLPVEFVGKVPGFDSLTQIVVRLPDGLAKGNALVSVTFHAKTSNKAFIVIE